LRTGLRAATAPSERRPGATRRPDTADRIESIDWNRVLRDLDDRGNATIANLLDAEQCAALAGLYRHDELFRSRVVMARHGYGRGEYKYFSYPLPEIVATLRTGIYPQLAPIANRWNAAMGVDVRYPLAHDEFIARLKSELPPTGSAA